MRSAFVRGEQAMFNKPQKTLANALSIPSRSILSNYACSIFSAEYIRQPAIKMSRNPQKIMIHGSSGGNLEKSVPTFQRRNGGGVP